MSIDFILPQQHFGLLNVYMKNRYVKFVEFGVV